MAPFYRMNILGISALYHDSAACLVQNGEIISAAQEERFSRKKHDSSFPRSAIEYCLKYSGLKIDNLDYIVFYDKPLLKLERLLETYLHYAPAGLRSFNKAVPLWLKDKLWVKRYIQEELGFSGKILFAQHHQSHAASAFFASPYQEAAFLAIDGVGEWATASFGIGKGNKIKILSELHFPHSLGLLYSAFTYYLGFKVNSGEYKVMGLAPYGEPKYKDIILSKLIDLKKDGSFRVNMKYFNYCTGLTMVNRKFSKLFGGPPRKQGAQLTQRHMDLASSVQKVTEEIVLSMAKNIWQVTGQKNLCLSGGVALNCVSNGRISREGLFDGVWVQPAASDAGSALGAALLVWYQYLGNKREADSKQFRQQPAYLGPEYSDQYIQDYLDKEGILYKKLNRQLLLEEVADLIAEGKVIGWFQGRMEFGPRALGNRSILADPRCPNMQSKINSKIKLRESFRPFAPSVLADKASDYFKLNEKNPYMLFTYFVTDRTRRNVSAQLREFSGIEKKWIINSTIPAVTHVDYSARVQVVDEGMNPLYYQLLKVFDRKYNCSLLVNTSFNLRGEPIVCTPQEAFSCYVRTALDCLVMGSFLIEKNK